jgi:hypothetical protein
MEARVAQDTEAARVAQDTEQDIRERHIYRMVAVGMMLVGWSIGIVNLMGWARF